MKLLFGFIIGAAIVTIVVALYCALIIAGHSDENENNGDNGERDDNEMFWKKKICPKCKTGKYTYDLDPKSETCPYIGCWKRNKCHFYKPLEKPVKPGIFKQNKNKVTITPENF